MAGQTPVPETDGQILALEMDGPIQVLLEETAELALVLTLAPEMDGQTLALEMNGQILALVLTLALEMDGQTLALVPLDEEFNCIFELFHFQKYKKRSYSQNSKLS